MSHYYEVHITVDSHGQPSESDRHAFQTVMDEYEMRLADFSSGDDGVPERVLTCRLKRRDAAYSTVIGAVNHLRVCGVRVLRYKVELAVLDSKIEDTLEMLT